MKAQHNICTWSVANFIVICFQMDENFAQHFNFCANIASTYEDSKHTIFVAANAIALYPSETA